MSHITVADQNTSSVLYFYPLAGIGKSELSQLIKPLLHTQHASQKNSNYKYPNVFAYNFYEKQNKVR